MCMCMVILTQISGNNYRTFILPRDAFIGGNSLELQSKLMHFSSCWRQALESLNPTFPAVSHSSVLPFQPAFPVNVL